MRSTLWNSNEVTTNGVTSMDEVGKMAIFNQYLAISVESDVEL